MPSSWLFLLQTGARKTKRHYGIGASPLSLSFCLMWSLAQETRSSLRQPQKPHELAAVSSLLASRDHVLPCSLNLLFLSANPINVAWVYLWEAGLVSLQVGITCLLPFPLNLHSLSILQLINLALHYSQAETFCFPLCSASSVQSQTCGKQAWSPLQVGIRYFPSLLNLLFVNRVPANKQALDHLRGGASCSSGRGLKK